MTIAFLALLRGFSNALFRLESPPTSIDKVDACIEALNVDDTGGARRCTVEKIRYCLDEKPKEVAIDRCLAAQITQFRHIIRATVDGSSMSLRAEVASLVREARGRYRKCLDIVEYQCLYAALGVTMLSVREYVLLSLHPPSVGKIGEPHE